MMTYQEKLKAVISRLDGDGADSEEEWAANILKSIGITTETPNGEADKKIKELEEEIKSIHEEMAEEDI